jgi:twinkle protein
MSIECSKPLHIPDTQISEAEWEATFQSTLGTRRVVYYDGFGESNIDRILSYIKYLAKAEGCKIIFLDHISIIVSDQSQGDERKALDEVATKLKKLTMELDILLIMVSHSKRQSSKPHEEGGHTSLADLRGTAAIGQLSNIVLGLERDGQAEDPVERNTTLIRVLKNRFSGLTGPSSLLLYSKLTGRLEEVKFNDDSEELEPEDEEKGDH